MLVLIEPSKFFIMAVDILWLFCVLLLIIVRFVPRSAFIKANVAFTRPVYFSFNFGCSFLVAVLMSLQGRLVIESNLNLIITALIVSTLFTFSRVERLNTLC